ncbi:MAG: hypothetical protein IVW57_03155 [Ktedonobacterales bacterium]|nr:hypothetical protein [Ktedonobacterales bacterium]
MTTIPPALSVQQPRTGRATHSEAARGAAQAAHNEGLHWLRAQLLDHHYASEGPGNKMKFYLTALERDIARELPDAPVSLETLRTVVYRGAVPSHHTARGLAAALHISEVAILLRFGQLAWDAVTPLLDTRATVLRSPEEYAAERARAERDIADPHWRARMLALLDGEWEVTQALAARLRWLGITPQEWEVIRRGLNTPEGRRRFVSALYAHDAASGAAADAAAGATLPQEYLDHANDTGPTITAPSTPDA